MVVLEDESDGVCLYIPREVYEVLDGGCHPLCFRTLKEYLLVGSRVDLLRAGESVEARRLRMVQQKVLDLEEKMHDAYLSSESDVVSSTWMKYDELVGELSLELEVMVEDFHHSDDPDLDDEMFKARSGLLTVIERVDAWKACVEKGKSYFSLVERVCKHSNEHTDEDTPDEQRLSMKVEIEEKSKEFNSAVRMAELGRDVRMSVFNVLSHVERMKENSPWCLLR
jgi:hypothetical protein